MKRVTIPAVVLAAALLLLFGAYLALSGPALADEQGEGMVVAGLSEGQGPDAGVSPVPFQGRPAAASVSERPQRLP
ncbi:hypothetical protein ATO6_06490 [Oceanicola sp. 22II-s10i]|nr:hypothetical protein ATO6_06490 [Oceanicola sp. 22II-s10i]